MASPPAWYKTACKGLGGRGQVLNWIGAKRYGSALHPGLLPAGDAQAAIIRGFAALRHYVVAQARRGAPAPRF